MTIKELVKVWYNEYTQVKVYSNDVSNEEWLYEGYIDEIPEEFQDKEIITIYDNVVRRDFEIGVKL